MHKGAWTHRRDMSSQKLIKVTVRTTEELLFSGEVDRLTSYNEVGKFDVFPSHANFISIIERNITLYFNNQVVKEIEIERAVMKVKQDIANIYMGIEALLIGEDIVLPEGSHIEQAPPKLK